MTLVGTLTAGVLTDIEITDWGDGYTSAPPVTVTGTGGSGAAVQTYLETAWQYLRPTETSTTPSLAGGVPVHIAAGSAVTDFLGLFDGQRGILISDGARTVNHSAGVVELAGSVNYAMTAGDLLEVVNDNGVLKELGRTVL